MSKKRYMELLLEQIRNRKAKQMISDEVEGHIDDQIEAYQHRGMSENEAEKRAVFEMGDPVEIGESLDRIHKPQMSWSTIILVGILSVIGLFLQGSIWRMGFHADVDGYLFQNQILYVGIGFFIMLLICFIDYSVISRWIPVLSVCFLLLCVWYTFFGAGVNGSKRYLCLPGGVSLAYHCVIYLAIPLFAILLYYYRNKGRYRMLIPFGFMISAVVLFWLSTGSLMVSVNLIWMSAILSGIVIFKGWFLPEKKRHLLGVLGGCGIALSVLLMFVFTGPAYLAERVRFFTLGNSQAYGLSSIREQLSRCQVLGGSAGPGQTITDILGIQSDYVLLYAASQCGILVLLIVVALLAVLCCNLFRLAFNQKNQLGMILGTGCSMIFVFQILEYILMNLGIFPPTTVFLPLFSCGGSGTIVSYILLGVLLSIYRYQNLITENSIRKKRRRLVIELKEY